MYCKLLISKPQYFNNRPEYVEVGYLVLEMNGIGLSRKFLQLMRQKI